MQLNDGSVVTLGTDEPVALLHALTDALHQCAAKTRSTAARWMSVKYNDGLRVPTPTGSVA
jgi:hypothetical protein